MEKNTPRKIKAEPTTISKVNVSSKMSIPKDMLDTGTKYVTKDAFNDPILLINLMKITYAKDVLMIPKIAI